MSLFNSGDVPKTVLGRLDFSFYLLSLGALRNTGFWESILSSLSSCFLQLNIMHPGCYLSSVSGKKSLSWLVAQHG